jgi:hypothetical protein
LKGDWLLGAYFKGKPPQGRLSRLYGVEEPEGEGEALLQLHEQVVEVGHSASIGRQLVELKGQIGELEVCATPRAQTSTSSPIRYQPKPEAVSL